MHLSVILVFAFLQNVQTVDSPRIQPIPPRFTTETNKKPVIQDGKPDSSFVIGSPTENSDGGSIVEPKSSPAIQPASNPLVKQGEFNPRPATSFSLEQDSEAKKTTTSPPATPATSTLQDDELRPLRSPSSAQPTPPVQSGFNRTPLLSGQANGETQGPGLRNRTSSSGSVQGTFSNPPSGSADFNRSNLPAEKRGLPVDQTVDPTFNPQLKLLSEQILKTLPRTVGNRISLVNLLATATGASERKEKLVAYWDGFASQSDLVFASEEVRILKSISRTNSQLDSSLLRAAIASSTARYAEAELAAAKANTKLHQMVPTLDKKLPVSYADLPWVGKFKTGTKSLISSGRFDPKIRNVDVALPAMRDLIHLRAAAVAENLQALSESMLAYENGQVRIETVLALHREVRDQRIAFLGGVRNYNIAIANYAISVFPDVSDSQTVARMLVDTSQTLPTVQSNPRTLDDDLASPGSGVRQAQNLQNERAGRRGIRDSRVRPAAGF